MCLVFHGEYGEIPAFRGVFASHLGPSRMGLTPTRIAHRLLKEIALERWTGDGIALLVYRVANKNGERNMMKYVSANMGIKQTIGNDDLYRTCFSDKIVG